MKYLATAALFLSLMAFVACSKTGSSSGAAIVGTWIFSSQYSQSFAYPSIITNPYPFVVSNWTNANDSLRVSFGNNGHYSFSNLRQSVDNGTYTVVQDSLLVIKPDTSGFVKFCYTTPTFYFGSFVPGTPLSQIPLPYANFHFTSDTILFKKTSGNQLTFVTFWLTKATTAVLPGQDTIIINQATSYFKKP